MPYNIEKDFIEAFAFAGRLLEGLDLVHKRFDFGECFDSPTHTWKIDTLEFIREPLLRRDNEGFRRERQDDSDTLTIRQFKVTLVASEGRIR